MAKLSPVPAGVLRTVRQWCTGTERRAAAAIQELN